MTLDGRGPALQVFGVLIGHRREPLLDRRHAGFGLAPETFDLRLEVGEPLLEFGEFQHECLSRMIHKSARVAVRKRPFLLRRGRCHVRISSHHDNTELTHTCEV